VLSTVIRRLLREAQAHADKREAEEQRRAAEAKYRSLVEQIPAIAYTAALSVPGKLLYVTPHIQQLGFSPEQCWQVRTVYLTASIPKAGRECSTPSRAATKPASRCAASTAC
jgi:hypothetical protein